MFNKELEAGMLALNMRIDNLQKNVTKILEILQEPNTKLADKDSPFLTKEGLFNYKHRKPKPNE